MTTYNYQSKSLVITSNSKLSFEQPLKIGRLKYWVLCGWNETTLNINNNTVRHWVFRLFGIRFDRWIIS